MTLELQVSTSETMPGFFVKITNHSEPLAEQMYRDGEGHETSLSRCHADGRVDFPTIGPGWPFNLGTVSRIGTQVW